MFNTRLFGLLFVLAFFLAACGPATITAPGVQPLPSPSGPWNVTLTQSGGLAGVQLTVEVSSNGRLDAENVRLGKRASRQLDAATLDQLSGLVSAIPASTPQLPASKCADCFLYDLQITSGARTIHIQADDTTLAASGAGELVGLLRGLRDATLKGQP